MDVIPFGAALYLFFAEVSDVMLQKEKLPAAYLIVCAVLGHIHRPLDNIDEVIVFDHTVNETERLGRSEKITGADYGLTSRR